MLVCILCFWILLVCSNHHLIFIAHMSCIHTFNYISLQHKHAGNEFFLAATGLSERDAKRLTIFSIVQSSQLSNLYKMVARALAPNIVAAAAAGGNNKSGDDEEWQAITLKCAPFTNIKNTVTSSADTTKQGEPGAESSSENTTTATTTDSQSQQQLYITVALMEDEKMANRCFHCILTDCPGTNGELGIVTPELFQKLFTPSNKKKKVGK